MRGDPGSGRGDHDGLQWPANCGQVEVNVTANAKRSVYRIVYGLTCTGLRQIKAISIQLNKRVMKSEGKRKGNDANDAVSVDVC